MSDSSLSNGSPSDATLEQALRHAIQQVYDSGRMEELTVKRIRVSAETDLDLPEDFFKNDPTWKERSKSLIQSEVVRAKLELLYFQQRVKLTIALRTRTMKPTAVNQRPHSKHPRKFIQHYRSRKSQIGRPKEQNAPQPRKEDLRNVERRMTQIKTILQVSRRKRQAKSQ